MPLPLAVLKMPMLLSRKRRAAPSFLVPRGGRAGRSPALGALMTGNVSTVSAHGVAHRLIRDLPNVTHVELAGLGHMGPVTHPDLVNTEIERFLFAKT